MDALQVRGDSAASVVDTVSVAWQASNMVNRPASAAAKRGAVAELMLECGETTWYKVLELDVATASVKVVCTFSVRTSSCLVLGKGCIDLGHTTCTMRETGGACVMVCGGCKVWRR